jgi:hypothetical protein
MEPLFKQVNMSSLTSDVYDIGNFLDPSPADRGRGFVYFDEGFESCLVNCTTCSGSPEQNNRVIVYDKDMQVIPDTSYMIDYIDCRIVADKAVVPAYIDYYWNYVSVVDEWSAVQAAEPPVVVIDISGTDKKGYQLGGGQNIIRKVSLHIFASSTAERNDLVEVLYDALYLKSCPLYELPKGSVLDHDGTFFGRRYNNDKELNLFDRATISGVSSLTFENVSSRHINLPITMTKGRDDIMLSDLNAYRSKITFDMFSYTNG